MKTKITNLNGELSIDSELNKGCKVTIKLPVSMSTIKTFILVVNEQKYAIPVNAIKYVKQIRKDEIFRKNGQDCIVFDEHSVPIFSLSSVLGETAQHLLETDVYTVIIIENADKQVAFITDKLLGDQEVFHKKLVAPVLKIKNISGFTTLSTGEICLIINPYELIRNTVYESTSSLFEMKHYALEDTKNERKIIILDDDSVFMNSLSRYISSQFKNALTFNNINSVYDYVLKNKTDILICKINDKDDEVIRLAKYLRTDENLSNIKLVVLSEIPEYEIIRDEKDFGYTYYQKITEYSQESFVNVIMKI